MQFLKLYYSNSLLSTYLEPSQEDLSDIHNKDKVPTISVDPPQLPSKSVLTVSSNANTPVVGSPKSSGDLTTSVSNQSFTSYGSSATSVFSCESGFSDDIDLQSLQNNIDAHEMSRRHSRFHKIKRFLKHDKTADKPPDEETVFFESLRTKMTRDYYSYEKNQTLDVDWKKASEVFAFGDPLSVVLPSDETKLRYLTQSQFELGELRFSNLNKFHQGDPDAQALLREVTPALQEFKKVLDLYAESDTNLKRQDLFEIFSKYANHSEGLCIPLAIAMFGNWLLSYNRDSNVENNYDNSLILNYFRKGLRVALVMKELAPRLKTFLDETDKHKKILLKKYMEKDNDLALSLCLHSLGEYYQYMHDYNMAVTLWELNGHLTADLDSGNLTVLGLSDGYGFGNKIKESRFGKRSKTNKFNTKRRVAHMYRILMERPDFREFGVSWATKEKYD